MNTHDILMYGHRWVHRHVDDLTREQLLIPNVCGVWSSKEIIDHLASFEYLLGEVFANCTIQAETPLVNSLNSLGGDEFNRVQVEKRANYSPEDSLRDYDAAYAEVMRHLPSIDEATLRRPGEIPWYGSEYSLEDFVVYQYYGHKREHCAQIAVFRDTLK